MSSNFVNKFVKGYAVTFSKRLSEVKISVNLNVTDENMDLKKRFSKKFREHLKKSNVLFPFLVYS